MLPSRDVFQCISEVKVKWQLGAGGMKEESRQGSNTIQRVAKKTFLDQDQDHIIDVWLAARHILLLARKIERERERERGEGREREREREMR
jgi:hypothetical protein